MNWVQPPVPQNKQGKKKPVVMPALKIWHKICGLLSNDEAQSSIPQYCQKKVKIK
jgi:hypothetical protein